MVALLSGGGEPSSFLRWQNEVLQQDLQEEMALLERRRLEGLISHEEAALARVRVMESNQQRALLKREEVPRDYARKRYTKVYDDDVPHATTPHLAALSSCRPLDSCVAMQRSGCRRSRR